eukprot:8927880-Alexandrium_andersonii.AAC.1
MYRCAACSTFAPHVQDICKRDMSCSPPHSAGAGSRDGVQASPKHLGSRQAPRGDSRTPKGWARARRGDGGERQLTSMMHN